jgi:trehalose-phosphatase
LGGTVRHRIALSDMLLAKRNGGGRELNPKDLRPQQIGLFLDVDGTLLDLAPSPGAIEVPTGLRDTLAAAERSLDGALALVSGRPIGQLDRLFAPLRLRASGTHGAEIRQSADTPGKWLTQARLPERAWRDLGQLLDGFPGTFAENKEVGFAVHYQFAGADEVQLVAALRDFVETFGAFDLELSAGQRLAAALHGAQRLSRYLAAHAMMQAQQDFRSTFWQKWQCRCCLGALGEPLWSASQ